MADQTVNPIASVGDESNIPPPSTYVWDLQDISAPNAGRTEDGKMQKKRIGQAVKLSLGWKYVTTEDASTILQAFNPEYINVSYLDPMSGGFERLQFYVGDRTAPMYNATMGLWENISFNIIDRNGEIKEVD